MPAGFQYKAETSFTTAWNAPLMPAPRASGAILRNCMPEVPVRELPKEGNIWALSLEKPMLRKSKTNMVGTCRIR
jgi:hypothetical protein